VSLFFLSLYSAAAYWHMKKMNNLEREKIGSMKERHYGNEKEKWKGHAFEKKTKHFFLYQKMMTNQTQKKTCCEPLVIVI
jgi:hypothetical protein